MEAFCTVKNVFVLYGTNFLYLRVFTEVCLVRKRIAPVGEMFERALCYSTMFNLTDSIEQNLSWKPDSRLATSDIPHFCRN